MKRALCLLCAAVLLALCLAGCGRALTLGFSAEEVTALNVYAGGVPDAAQKKRVEDAAEIARILKLLGRIRTGREAGPEDLLAGGIGLYFQFELAGGGAAVVHLASGGGTVQTADGFFTTRSAPHALRAENEFWAALPGETQAVPGAELPALA